MARKKREEGGGGGAPEWMATFSDLMNLLLCFFVLLFAFSSVDAEKFAEISASFNSSFGIFSGGAQAIGEGKMIGQGVSQMNYLSEYYNEMGMEAGDATEAGETQSGDKDNSSEYKSDEKAIEDYKQQQKQEQKEITENMYEEVMEATQKKQIQDDVSVTMDENYQFVQISLSGAILFDSGKEKLKTGALPILDKLGTILKIYDRYDI
ncbi:MAG: flagellar motor protein MotB, partial [Acetivibrio sp.]